MDPRCVPPCIRARNWTRTSTSLSDTATSTLRVYHSTIRANKTDSGVTIVRILSPFSAGVSACRTVTGARRVRSQLDGCHVAGNSLSAS